MGQMQVLGGDEQLHVGRSHLVSVNAIHAVEPGSRLEVVARAAVEPSRDLHRLRAPDDNLFVGGLLLEDLLHDVPVVDDPNVSGADFLAGATTDQLQHGRHHPTVPLAVGARVGHLVALPSLVTRGGTVHAAEVGQGRIRGIAKRQQSPRSPLDARSDRTLGGYVIVRSGT